MKNIKILFVAAALCVAMSLAACDKEPTTTTLPPVEETLTEKVLAQSEYGIYNVAGTSLQNTLLFSKGDHQLYFAKASRCFRMLSNDAMKYVEVKLNTNPSPGMTVGGRITVDGLAAGVGTQDIFADVLKQEDGKCWMLCQGADGDSFFGVVAMWIE